MPGIRSFSPSPPAASPDKRSGREVGARGAGVFPQKLLGKAPVLRAMRCARGRRRLVTVQHAFSMLLALFACFVCAGSALAQKLAEKPRVPPGVDPGGVAIAIIGNGIDYTRPAFASRLARDGEGEIVGWDFVDNDRRPFNSCNATEITIPCPNDFLGWFSISDKPARLIFYRATANASKTLVEAVQSGAQTPARIVVLTLFPPPPIEFLIEASTRYPNQFFIGIIMDTANPSGKLTEGPNYLAVSSGLPPLKPPDYSARIAAAHAINAASIAASNPKLDGRGIKGRLFPPKPGGTY